MKRYQNIKKKYNDFLKEQKNNHIYFTINNKNNKNNKLISKQLKGNNKSTIGNISVPWNTITRTTITLLKTTKTSILTTI